MQCYEMEEREKAPERGAGTAPAMSGEVFIIESLLLEYIVNLHDETSSTDNLPVLMKCDGIFAKIML